MTDHVEHREDLAHSAMPLSPSGMSESLESRLHRLENALAAIQDTRLMEERLLERVIHRIEDTNPNGAAKPETDAASAALLAAGTSMLPVAMHAIGSHLDAVTSPTASPNSGMFSAKSWLLTDIAQEFRTFFTLYFDYRYRTSWLARIVPPAALSIFILSWIFLHGSVPFIGSAMDYAVDFVLAIVLYKTLQREAVRYRAHISAFPRGDASR